MNLVTMRVKTLQQQWMIDLVYWIQEFSLRQGYQKHPTCGNFDSWPVAFPAAYSGETGLQLLGLALLEELCLPASPTNKRWAVDWMSNVALDPSNEALSKSGNQGASAAEALQKLRAIKEQISKAHLPMVAKTSITTAVFDLLEYTDFSRGLCIAEGTHRVGKTYSSQAWALAHSDRWRLVSLSSCNDEETFFRQIARSIGVSTALTAKMAQIRERVEAALAGGHVGLIFDEAAFILPNSLRTKQIPGRLAWLITAVLNRNTPVALICSRDWSRKIAALKRTLTCFGWEQLSGRTRLKIDLPDTMSEADLVAIVRCVAPDLDEASTYLIAAAAMHHSGHVATIEATVARARYIAQKMGESISWDFILAALREIDPSFRIPSANGSQAPRKRFATSSRS